MHKQKTNTTIISQSKLAPGIYDLWLTYPAASRALPGQFVGLYPQDQSRLLMRPISICESNPDQNSLRLVYRVQGAGTGEFSQLKAGDNIALLGILGNGFPLAQASAKHVYIIGGGIGIPPLLGLAKAIQKEAKSLNIFLGYPSAPAYLADEMAACGRVHIATDDGSLGIKGHVMDAVLAATKLDKLPRAGIIMACGPGVMLAAVKAYAKEAGVPAYISLEERMACGIGACLSCVCQTTKANENNPLNLSRICADGPVYEAGDVEVNP